MKFKCNECGHDAFIFSQHEYLYHEALSRTTFPSNRIFEDGMPINKGSSLLEITCENCGANWRANDLLVHLENIMIEAGVLHD